MTSTGWMRERVRFERRANDDNGDPLGAWTEIATCAARVQPLKGSEPVMAQRLEGVSPFVIYVRASIATRSVDNACRAVDTRSPVDDPFYYDITDANLSENRKEMEFLATWKAGGKG